MALRREARAVDRLVDAGRLLQPVRPAVLRDHAHPASAAALVGPLRDRAVVRRPAPRPALRVRHRLHRGRRDGDHERDARLLDAAHVGEPRVRVLLSRDLRARHASRHADHGRRVHGRRHATRPRSRAHELALRLRVPVVRRNHGRVPDRVAGLDGRGPARQEPRVPEVVRLPESVQCAHGGGRRPRVDLQERRLRLGRRDRVVDQHGRVRHLHDRLPHPAAKNDPARGLRHRAAAGSLEAAG